MARTLFDEILLESERPHKRDVTDISQRVSAMPPDPTPDPTPEPDPTPAAPEQESDEPQRRPLREQWLVSTSAGRAYGFPHDDSDAALAAMEAAALPGAYLSKVYVPADDPDDAGE